EKLLHHLAFIEEEGRVCRRSDPGDETGRAAEEAAAQERGQRRGRGAEEELEETKECEAVPEEREVDRQEVRVERALLEDLLPDPVARGDAEGPIVVVKRIEVQELEEGRSTELREEEEPDDEGDLEDEERVPQAGSPRCRGPGRSGSVHHRE